MKKATTLLLCLAMLLPTLSACGSSPDTSPSSSDSLTESTVDMEETETETEAETIPQDSLPEKDFGGRTVQVLTAAEQWSYFYEAEQTGNVMDDAVYARNLAVEERFKVDIEHALMNGYTAGMSQVKAALSGSVMSGGNDYDLVTGCSLYVISLLTDKLMADLNHVDYLDLSQPWWMSNINKEVEIGNQLFFGAGYYGTLNIAWSVATFFNKDLITKYNLEEPYDKVLEGKWTWDTMLTMGETVLTDSNGDQTYYYEDDVIGIICTPDYMASMGVGQGIQFTAKEENGNVSILSPDDRVVSINERLVALAQMPVYGDHIHDPNKPNMYEIFANDHSLFMVYSLEATSNDAIRNMNGYGIIPLPKYDESQEQYITFTVTELAGIPAVVQDEEVSAIILEALQYESWKTVRPAYYEVTLKEKYSHDRLSSQMLDIIVEDTTCPFAYMYAFITGESIYQQSREAGFVTYMASKKSMFQQKIDDLVEALKKE